MGEDALLQTLKTRRDAIVREWVSRLHASSPRYGQRPTKELERTVGELVDGLCEVLEKGDRSKTLEAITRVAKLRTRQGFTLSETERSFHIGLDTMMAALHSDLGPENTDQCFIDVRRLMDLIHWVLQVYSDAFVDMMNKEFSAAVIVAVSAAEEGFNERDILSRSLQKCCKILDYDAGAVLSIDRGTRRVELAAHCGLDRALVEAIWDVASSNAGGIGAAIAADAMPRAIENNLEQVTAETGLPPEAGIRTLMGVPIIVRGMTTGVALLGSRTGRAVYPHDITFMFAMASQIGLACDNARLIRETQRLVGQLTLQYEEVSTMLSELEAIMYVADMDTYEVLAVNKYIEKLFGQGLRGRRCYEIFQKGQTQPCSFCTNRHLVVDGTPAPPYVWKFQNTVTGRWFQCIDRAIRWPDGRLVRMEVAVDVTDLEAARSQLEDAHRMLELLNDLMVHDVGNCVDAARAYLELMREGPGITEKQKEMILTAILQAKEARRVIDNVSKLVKIKSAKEEALVPQDLAALVEEAITDVRRMEEGRQLKVRSEVRKGKCYARMGAFAADIFVNLISNAAKFGNGKPVDVSITECDISGTPAWKVTVADEGKGIPQEMRSVIFQRFERLDELKKSKGMGLGLALVKSLVERYGGRIEIDDRVPGEYAKGTCFSVTFPKAGS